MNSDHHMEPSRRPDWSGLAVATLAFLAMALWAKRMLLPDWATHLPLGFVTDQDVFCWNMWWVREALTRPDLDLFHCTLLFYPLGFEFLLHSHAMVYCGTGALLSGLGLTLPAAFNSVSVLGIILTGLGLWLLLREVGAGRWAALIGATALAMWPYHIHSVSHFNYYAIEWIPFMLWATVRAHRRASFRWAALAGALLGGALWQSYYITAIGGLLWTGLTAAHGVRAWRERRLRSWLRALAWTGATALLISLPVLLPMIAIQRGANYTVLGGHNIYVADPFEMFLPPKYHPVWGGLIDPLMNARGLTGFPRSLGWVSLGLAMAGVLFHHRRRWTAMLVFGWLTMMALAFGENMHIGGQWEFGNPADPTSIPLPYHWLRHAPPFDNLRIPERFLIGMMVCETLLVGLGADAILCRAKRPPIRHALGAGLLALMLFEFFPANAGTHDFFESEMVRPEINRLIATDPKAGTVMELPMEYENQRASNANQVFHRRPVLFGHASRYPHFVYTTRQNFLRPLASDGVLSFFDLAGLEPIEPSPVEWRRFQWLFDLTHVIVFPHFAGDPMAVLPEPWHPHEIARDGEVRLIRLEQPAFSPFEAQLTDTFHLIHFPRGFQPDPERGVHLEEREGLILLRGEPGRGLRVEIDWPNIKQESAILTFSAESLAESVFELDPGTQSTIALDIPAEALTRDGHLFLNVSRASGVRVTATRLRVGLVED